MLEPWRSQYLRALGVDIYLPRYDLPAAAPSIAPEWDDSVFTDLPQTAAPIVEEATASPPVEVGVPAAALERPTAERRSPRPAETNPAPVSARTNAPTLRIKLHVYVSDGGVLIIDDAAPAGRGDAQRLLTNLLFALHGKSTQLSGEIFDWPLPSLRNRPLDLNEDAARETLAGLLHRKVGEANVHTVLLLGANAQHWLNDSLRQTLSADRSLRWLASHSCASVLANPLLKRQWWADLFSVAT